jgi:hypothetical protein
MIACVGRVLRLSLAVAFVSGLGFVATNANAQFVDEELVCADPNSVFTNFDDAFKWNDFGDVSNCKKICNSYANKCKSYVKNNASCLNKAAGDNAELNKKAFCDAFPDKSDRKECNSDEKAAEKLDGKKVVVQGSLERRAGVEVKQRLIVTVSRLQEAGKTGTDKSAK